MIRLASESLRGELDMPEAASMAPELAAFIGQKLKLITSQTERASGIVRDLRTAAANTVRQARPLGRLA